MNKNQLRIMVAPLDWGLGHLTRCLPLIHFLIQKGHIVLFAGNETQQHYMLSVFDNIECIDLEGYDVQYAQSKIGLLPKIIAQIPKIKRKIKRENIWLNNAVITHKIDAVISDNRYGLFHSKIPSIFITHQLKVRTGLGQFFDNMLQKIHYNYINKFNQCWVVDIAADSGLSGTLGHPTVLPKVKTSYLGLLSQCKIKANEIAEKEAENYVLILLSGNEPQRSILAEMLWRKAIQSDRQIIFVSGSENTKEPPFIPEHISYHKRLSADDLVRAIKMAEIVICRSGYSSLMDLIALDKKAILIPTPGQTEQEYLAKQMHKNKIFMAASQSKFDIQTSLMNATLFPFQRTHFENAFEKHKLVLSDWLQKIGE